MPSNRLGIYEVNDFRGGSYGGHRKKERTNMARNTNQTPGTPDDDFELFLILSIDKVDTEEKDGVYETDFTVKVTNAKKKPKNGERVTLFGGENADVNLGTETTVGAGIASITAKVAPGKHKFQARLDDGTLSNPVKRKIGDDAGGASGAPVDGDIEKEFLYDTDATFNADGTVATPATKTYGCVATFPDKNGKGVKGTDGVLAFCKKGKNIKIVSKGKAADGSETTITGRGPHKIIKGGCAVEVTVESRINKVEFQLSGFSKSKEVVLTGPKPVSTKASKANNRRWYALCGATLAVFLVAMVFTFTAKAPEPKVTPPENFYQKHYGVENAEQLIALREGKLEKKDASPKTPTPSPIASATSPSIISKLGPASKVLWGLAFAFLAIGFTFKDEGAKKLAFFIGAGALVASASAFGISWIGIASGTLISLKWGLWIFWTFILVPAVPIYGIIAFREEVQDIAHEFELKILLAKDDKKSEAEIAQHKEFENKASHIHQWMKFVAKVVGVDLSVEAILGFLTNKK